MERKDRNLIIGIIIFGVIAIFLSQYLNAPGRIEIVNEVGEPLIIDEVWSEPGIFEVKINEMKEIPIDSLRIGNDEIQQNYTIYDKDLIEYKQKGITRAAEIIFEFKNINYDGYKRSGLVFDVTGIGYDKDGQIIEDSYGIFDSLGGVSGYFGFDEEIEKGMTSENNRLILLMAENTRRIELRFMAVAEKRHCFYEKHFYYEFPLISKTL